MKHIFGKGIGIDLGTTSIMVYVTGKGVVLTEPSVVARRKSDHEIVAIGKTAGRMLGRNPDSIEVIEPIREGVISDFFITEEMLRYYVEKVCKYSILKPKIMICMPSSITSFEKHVLLDVAIRSGAGAASLIEEPLAAAIGAGIQFDKPHGVMVVDIGGGSTDIAVITMGSIAISSSIKIAGNVCNDTIERYVKNRYGVLIGPKTAEHIKKEIGSAIPRDTEIGMTVKGKDHLTGMPVSFEITSTDVFKALRYPVKKIAEGIREVFEQTPPELSSDISDTGIVLTGGGALLYGLDKMIQRKTGIDTRVAENSEYCVINGMEKALKDEKAIVEHREFYRTSEDYLLK